MHLLDLLRGYFAILEGKTYYTIDDRSPFTIVRAIPKTPRQYATWLMEIQLESGTAKRIYYSDMLRVYAWLANYGADPWRTLLEICKAKLVQIGTGTESYLLPLMETLEDVEIQYDPPAVRVVYPER